MKNIIIFTLLSIMSITTNAKHKYLICKGDVCIDVYSDDDGLCKFFPKCWQEYKITAPEKNKYVNNLKKLTFTVKDDTYSFYFDKKLLFQLPKEHKNASLQIVNDIQLAKSNKTKDLFAN